MEQIKGAKYDEGKPRPSLVPVEAIEAIMQVREFGKAKYADAEDWRKVPREKWLDALLRHVLHIWDNPMAIDNESGLPALWHVITNAAFLCAAYKKDMQAAVVQKAVNDRMKSERLKTELITNVSHDIKTPLTSIVNYVDLLKKEELTGKAAEYVDVLDRQSARLKKLTEDLFDAAKASSGAMPVDIQQLELVSLINQALAETEERFEARNLNVIFSNKADSVHVMADGQLLWRVMENLFVNASKYALAGSRVYVDLIENGENLTVEVKNMSEAQLNISADELMERFQRGDASRNTEGSGLGLAIAKDLTKLMNGEFKLTVDGDLFKAGVLLERA